MKVQELFEADETKSKETPFQGGRKTTTVTKKHKPLIWENMLGTVYARKYDDIYSRLEPKYFDYDWDAARAYAGVSKCEDLRICKNKSSYQNYPRVGQLVLWGIPKNLEELEKTDMDQRRAKNREERGSKND